MLILKIIERSEALPSLHWAREAHQLRAELAELGGITRFSQSSLGHHIGKHCHNILIPGNLESCGGCLQWEQERQMYLQLGGTSQVLFEGNICEFLADYCEFSEEGVTDLILFSGKAKPGVLEELR